jgi:hypothetical protein
MPTNFKAYTVTEIKKVNAQRRALSQPESRDVPALSKGEVMYVPEAKMCGEPASCYNCLKYNVGRSCQIIGPDTRIEKFIYPKEATADAKRVEYWPCCFEWRRGTPNYGPVKFVLDASRSTPDEVGLGWINAPRTGQEAGGANCGGKDGGDDCDHYITRGDDKRAECSAFCRVLQQDVENGAVCSAWRDDDWLSWDKARTLMKELEGK